LGNDRGIAVIVVAGIAYGVVTLRRQPASVLETPTTGLPTQSVPPAIVAAPTPAQQPVANATKTEASDSLRLDLVTDCDRLAALPSDPQAPPSIPGILSPYQIDIVPALTACNAAMRQYPDVARAQPRRRRGSITPESSRADRQPLWPLRANCVVSIVREPLRVIANCCHIGALRRPHAQNHSGSRLASGG
jgi:hypothetical protein